LPPPFNFVDPAPIGNEPDNKIESCHGKQWQEQKVGMFWHPDDDLIGADTPPNRSSCLKDLEGSEKSPSEAA
jgi:hypothetical protein